MRKLARILLWTAIILGVIVAAARFTAIRWWRVPDNDPFLEASVAPTLRGGDLVVLWRLTSPRYGDLVVCPEPKYPERVIIGRIVGEDNDHVKTKETQIEVNGRTLETERRCEDFTVHDPDVGTELEQTCQIEVVGQAAHMRGSAAGHSIRPRDVEIKVPPGHVFLASDNRLFPYDSRDFGSVERSTCKESVVFRLVSKEGFFDVPARLTLIH